MRFRRARLEDAGAMCAVHRTSIRELCVEHYSAAEVAAWTGVLRPELYLPAIVNLDVRVACDGKRIVGFCMLDQAGGELRALYVDSAVAGRGVGRRLTCWAEGRARAAGLTRLVLKSTLNAVGFYEQVGFERGRRTTHPGPDGLELGCVEMSKQLAVARGQGEEEDADA